VDVFFQHQERKSAHSLQVHPQVLPYALCLNHNRSKQTHHELLHRQALVDLEVLKRSADQRLEKAIEDSYCEQNSHNYRIHHFIQRFGLFASHHQEQMKCNKKEKIRMQFEGISTVLQK